tara:strand:- start:622 stop:957 length:336 start_codon:yes stop_codon:yes gene_type:complete
MGAKLKNFKFLRIIIDIDETICITPGNKNIARDYTQSQPIKENIVKANKLYDQGHTIIYWTARGTKSGVPWFNVTYNQLKEWGVKFHELRMNKPAYDLMICDKVMNTEDWK